ncbi:uncharacterized protein EDB91DRAFT_600306 [Suillus paluster]|uniref:uncharacterized protein n=1 Tax=Suillus paluster TaxID=48578 RepID=UPI001B86C6F0|nr:uncharacterized protein EDB91DRAFT_600306 [Suillus paluster]KAG1751324.1 hypothetical protein EDB91DRAFT_600306 [Suillus paluster]
MFKMKCALCDVVVKRIEMPHHVRAAHNPSGASQNASETSFNAASETLINAASETLVNEPQAAAPSRETPLAPITTQADREAFKREIQDIVHVFNALPDQLRQECKQGVENMPVLGALYAYTFTHLQLCAPKKQSLIAELENLKAEWIRDSDASLLGLKTIKDGLVRVLQTSQVKKHFCNTRLIHEHRLHDLDIGNIAALNCRAYDIERACPCLLRPD